MTSARKVGIIARQSREKSYWLYNSQERHWIGLNSSDDLRTSTLSNIRIGLLTADALQIGEGEAAGSAAFRIDSPDKGFLPPRVLSVNTIIEPVEGLIVYDLSQKGLFIYNPEDGWQPIGSGSGFGEVGTVTETGEIIAESITSLSTVNATVFRSTAANGLAPLQVNSRTVVTNLNADLLDGFNGEYYLNKYTGRLYVSVTGSDNNDGRSIATAVRTIKRAAYLASLTTQDESIYVLSGDYYEDNPIQLPQNTALIGDNLRATKVRPLNEGQDLFWVSSGCQLSHMVFRDNYGNPLDPQDSNRGFGVLRTGAQREINETTLSFSLFPGHSLKTVPRAYRDAAALLAFQRNIIVNDAYAAILEANPSFVPPGPGTSQERVDRCRRDIGFVIDALVFDLRYGGNFRSIRAGKAYINDVGRVQFIQDQLAESLIAFTAVRELAKLRLAAIPGGFNQTITTTDFAVARQRIDYLLNIVIGLLQGQDAPYEEVGPGFILIDQEWCEVDTIVGNTVTLLQRGVSPFGEPNQAAKHISGAIVTQSSRAFRYAVAFPDQQGFEGRGRVNFTLNSNQVLGNGTRFVTDFYSGGSLRIGSRTYNITQVINDTALLIDAPIIAPEETGNFKYRFVPRRQIITLSPYTQNCSNISVLGRSAYDLTTESYIINQTRAGGILVDGAQLDPATPIRSMVCDAFTQIVSGGVGFHLKNDGYAQLVSVFQVFEDVGVLCESGGYASVTNSATNFGKEGLKAVGYSATALPFYANGQLVAISNLTRPVLNATPTPIQGSFLASTNDGSQVRVTLQLNGSDMNKFERGQSVTVTAHDSDLDVNGAELELIEVDFGSSQISYILNTPWEPEYETFIGEATGSVTVTGGRTFTSVQVNGFTKNPTANYILDIEGLSPSVGGRLFVVGDIIEPLENGLVRFSVEPTITPDEINTLPPNAEVRLYAPSTVNSSSHTFEFVGAGVNYAALPENGGEPNEAAQNVERNGGRCYVSATDQDGNFTVGPFFGVNLREGKVKFSGQISLGVIDALELRGSPGVPIFEFSTNPELGGAANSSDTRLATQKAVRDFVVNNLGNFIGLDKGTNSQPGLIVQLDATGKISAEQLPPASPINIYTVDGEVDRLVTEIDGQLLRQGDQVVQVNPAPTTIYILRTTDNGGGENPDNWVPLSTSEYDASSIVSGLINPSRLGTGTANETTFLNGLNQFVRLPRGVRSVSSALTIASDGPLTLLPIGSSFTITGATFASDLVTFTAPGHTFTAETTVTVTGVVPTAYNGTYTVLSTTATTFIASRTGNPGLYVSGGSVRQVNGYSTGYVDINLQRAQFALNQTTGTSSLGVARFAFNDFNISPDGAVSIREKSIQLSRIQDIAARTVLGNRLDVTSPVQLLSIGDDLQEVTEFRISLLDNLFTVSDGALDLGTLPTLYLTRSQTYRFRLTNLSGETFYITTNGAQTGSPPPSVFVRGVSNGGASAGVVIFNVPQDAPIQLYYQSGTTQTNYGQIIVVGDSVTEDNIFMSNLFYN